MALWAPLRMFALRPYQTACSDITQGDLSNGCFFEGTKHVVPIQWAWTYGANDWPQAKREKFANDMANLWPVELGLNRSKGALPPSEWLPPSGQCGYVARFLRIVRLYDLKPPPSEAQWLQSFLKECRS